MIIIAIIFGLILCFEWRYMQKKKRKGRTRFIVVSIAVLLFIGFEGMYYFREQWTIAKVIEIVFDPIEEIMLIRK